MRDHDEVLGRLALGLAAIAELSRHPRRKMPSNGLPAGYTLSTRFHPDGKNGPRCPDRGANG